MKIRCSAGHGEMEREDCLKCAMRGENRCGFDYSLLVSLYGGSEDRSKEIHVTDLLSCPRKVYLQKTQPAVEAPHEMLSRFKGLAIHNALEASNKAHNPFPPMLSEVPVNVNGLLGRIDLIYLTADKKMRLVDYKSAKDIYMDLVPYGEHEVQVNIYAWGIEQQYGTHVDELYIQYISHAGATQCKKCRRPVDWTPDGYQCMVCGKPFPNGHLGVALIPVKRFSDAEIKEVVEHRQGLLENALAKAELPAGEPGWICRYCPFECDVRGA